MACSTRRHPAAASRRSSRRSRSGCSRATATRCRSRSTGRACFAAGVAAGPLLLAGVSLLGQDAPPALAVELSTRDSRFSETDPPIRARVGQRDGPDIAEALGLPPIRARVGQWVDVTVRNSEGRPVPHHLAVPAFGADRAGAFRYVCALHPGWRRSRWLRTGRPTGSAAGAGVARLASCPTRGDDSGILWSTAAAIHAVRGGPVGRLSGSVRPIPPESWRRPLRTH